MGKHQKKRKLNKQAGTPQAKQFSANAPQHDELANKKVHVFVDDQNLFYGIINSERDLSYRIDFGSLLRVAATSSSTSMAREVGSAYIAGVVPDDDSFWESAKARGFKVHRGFLNASGRSKQDDAYLITQIMETLYEEEGPATIVLVAGDADYMPPLQKCIKKGWRVELTFTNSGGGISSRLQNHVHEFRNFSSSDIERH